MSVLRFFSKETKFKIYSLANGKCQNPHCSLKLDFIGGCAEFAHIYAREKGGPRFNINKNDKFISSYKNGLLLCSNCHTIIDKNPEDFKIKLLNLWKNEKQKIKIKNKKIRYKDQGKINKENENNKINKENKNNDIDKEIVKIKKNKKFIKNKININKKYFKKNSSNSLFSIDLNKNKANVLAKVIISVGASVNSFDSVF
jgi:hypothetical protein